VQSELTSDEQRRKEKDGFDKDHTVCKQEPKTIQLNQHLGKREKQERVAMRGNNGKSNRKRVVGVVVEMEFSKSQWI